MLTTRIGNDSKMVITGDLKQSDRSIDKNGLLDVMNKIRDYKARNTGDGVGIEMVEMNHSDIERSPIVSKILDIYAPFDSSIHKAISVEGWNFTQNVEIPKVNEVDMYKQSPTGVGSSDNDAALIPKSHMSKRDDL
jgi:hypothetical protein